MTSSMRQVLAKQPFERKLEQVAQLVAISKAFKAARSNPPGNHAKERDVLFPGENAAALLDQPRLYNPK